jgi:hypothetical protein
MFILLGMLVRGAFELTIRIVPSTLEIERRIESAVGPWFVPGKR